MIYGYLIVVLYALFIAYVNIKGYLKVTNLVM